MTNGDIGGGVETWWGAMDAGRKWLEELGRQVQDTAAHAVRASDFGPVVQSLEVLGGRMRLLEDRVEALDAKVDGLTAALGDLTAVLEAMATKVAS